MPRTSAAPVMKTGIQDSRDMEMPQEKPRVTVEKDGKPALSPGNLVEPAGTAHVDKEWAANMAFAKEKITIKVLDSTDENAEKTIRVWNNGDPKDFTRGVEVTCERRFVESLVRAKPTTYTQRAIKDPESGDVVDYANVSHRALRYPFQVIRDDNPMGSEWLKAIMAQP